jgi:RimJ/RimL family protein N-acetyltransferase
MFFRSQRLFLRPIWPEDWQQVLAGIADEAVVRQLALAPWPYGPSDAQAFCALPQEQAYPRLMITKPDDGALLGVISLGPLADGHSDAAMLGYWLARGAWGHGYATEAGHAMVMLARLLGHKRLDACHFVDNPASGRVLARLGFVPTGKVCAMASAGRHGEALAAHFRLMLGAGSQRPAFAWPSTAPDPEDDPYKGPQGCGGLTRKRAA